MNSKKLIAITFSTLILISTFSGCFGGDQIPEGQPRIVEVETDVSGFPSVFVDDGDKFIFDYRVTGAEFADEVKDTTYNKLITTDHKFLVVEFGARNRSHFEEFGNLPTFTVKYNGETFKHDPTATKAYGIDAGLAAYEDEKVRTKRKGKYVRIYEITNYDESIQNFIFVIDGPANGELEIDAAKMNEGKLR